MFIMAEKKFVICWALIVACLCTRVETIPKCTLFRLIHLPAFDDKAVSEYQISTLTVEKLWMCFRKCDEEERCLSFQYNRVGKSCALFAVGFHVPSGSLNPVSVESGAELYLMNGRLGAFGMECTSTSGCKYTASTCQANTCKCPTGYSYDPRTKACLKHCAQYGDTFSLFPEYGINGCNTKVVWVSGATACMQACKNEGGFLCINSEYGHSSGVCHLCNTALHSIIADGVYSPGWTFHHRNCAL